VGLALYVFGGLRHRCGTGGISTLETSGELWALNIATVAWSRVLSTSSDQTAVFAPPSSTLASLVGGGQLEAQAGWMKSAMFLVGGTNADCVSAGCRYPTPTDGLWAIDVASAETRSNDYVAEFDGNDVVQVEVGGFPTSQHPTTQSEQFIFPATRRISIAYFKPKFKSHTRKFK
jgi:hypothetical protein